jgi:hypothetical protein
MYQVPKRMLAAGLVMSAELIPPFKGAHDPSRPTIIARSTRRRGRSTDVAVTNVFSRRRPPAAAR